jgi:hypothetical protein
MNPNHVNTAIGGITAVTLAPDIAWVLAGMHPPVPDNLPGLIAAGLLWATHYGYNRWLAPAGPKATTNQS